MTTRRQICSSNGQQTPVHSTPTVIWWLHGKWYREVMGHLLCRRVEMKIALIRPLLLGPCKDLFFSSDFGFDWLPGRVTVWHAGLWLYTAYSKPCQIFIPRESRSRRKRSRDKWMQHILRDQTVDNGTNELFCMWVRDLQRIVFLYHSLWM